QADLVLTDIRMPNKDGMWLIARIEERKLPVTCIMVSAYDDQKYISAAIRNSHVYDYIFKPFMADEVESMLMAAAAHHRRQIPEESGEINLNLMLSGITQHNMEPVLRDLELFCSNDSLPLTQLKNMAYGWVMFISNNISASIPAASRMHETDIMNRIYACSTKTEIRQVFADYLLECSNRFISNDEVTTLVNGALNLINNELDNPDLNLNYVASRLEVTPNYLSGRFSRDMKQSFSNYLTHARINTARQLLSDISKKVYEVSIAVGFTDVSYFNKVFKEHLGVTPLQYRQQVISLNTVSNETDTSLLKPEETEELKNALLAAARKYPNMQPQDAVVLIWQNEYGCPEETSDSTETLRQLEKEYAEIPHGFGAEYEDIGNGLIRINLNNLDIKHYSLAQLNDDYRHSCGAVKGERERFLAKLEILKEMTEEGVMPFVPAKLNSYLNDYAKAGYPPVGHSEIMLDYYRPAYRVVMRSLVPHIHQ
ncbi:MAG: helix-turn-helix domain-containing protein, partial [Erysipelotrichaceae bacterium]|nr:helix-turn-helix domain-containing protein [Erysipelotrichaceae bacterium]